MKRKPTIPNRIALPTRFFTPKRRQVFNWPSPGMYSLHDYNYQFNIMNALVQCGLQR